MIIHKKGKKEIRKLIEDVSEGIDGDPIQVDLVVEVGTGAPPGLSDQSDLFPTFDRLPFLDQALFYVGVFRLEPIVMIEDDDIAVSVILADIGHHPIGRCNDRGPHFRTDVKPFVKLPLIGKRGNSVTEP